MMLKTLREGTRVRVKFIRDNVTDEVKAYLGKIGHIAHGGVSLNGIPGYYVRFDDGSLTKKFYQDEIEVIRR